MATGSQNLTTYYAKRIIGDTAAASAEKALLLIGTGVNTDTWILHKTGRATDYGIKYHYDYTNGTAGDADLVLFVGKGSVTAWVRLDTGDLYVLGKVGIGYDPTTSGNTYKLYVNGTMYVAGATTHAATVTFANNTLNAMGDDCYIGDLNSGGAICIKGITGNTNIRFIEKDGTAAGTLTWDGSAFTISHQLTTSGGLISPWIELTSATPFIDFHFGSSTADYTSRIIESSSGYLLISGKLGIGGSSTDYKLYVNGNTLNNGIEYFANGTTYYINNSANANLNNIYANSITGYNGTGFISSIAGSPWPCIRFDTRAGGTDYITIDQTTWAQIYAQVPAKRDTTYYSTRFFFRQYSKTANTTTRVGYYEDYYLPNTTDGRTTSVGYDIRTSKSSAYNVDTATRINGNLAAATTDVDRNIWMSSTTSADGIPNYISSFCMNPSTKVFTVPSGTRISPSAGALYLGNSGNQSWVYVLDMASLTSTDNWKITLGGVIYSKDTRGGNLRMASNWLGFYQNANAADSIYGYIQCNVDRMYFRKENSTANLSYYFDFNANVYTSAHFIGTCTASSWIGGLRDNNAGFNLTDATNTGSYWPWIRQTNTGSGRWFSLGNLNNLMYIMSSATSRTDNAYDRSWVWYGNDGHMVLEGGTYHLMILMNTSHSECSIAYNGNSGNTNWVVGRHGSNFGWWNGSYWVMDLHPVGRLWVGRDANDGERLIGVSHSTSGTIYMWANNGEKGIYSGTGQSTGYVILINSSGKFFRGKADSAATADKLGTNAGGASNPVYFTGGKPTACSYPKSGAWFTGVPSVGSDGIMEIGRYIDFHSSNASTADFGYRLLCDADGRISGSGTLALINNSLDNGYNALLYLEHQSNNDWAIRINKSGADYGIIIDTANDATYAITTPGGIRAHAFWACNGSNGERNIGVDSTTTGMLYLYANTSTKGLYSGSGYRTGSIIYIDSGNTIFYGNRWRTPNLELAEVDANCMGLCTYGQSTAKRLNVGALLVSSAWADASNVPTNGLYCKGDAIFNGNVKVNASNTTGGGLILSDDGDIVDLNDGFCAMRFSYGVRIHEGNRSGNPTIALRSSGTVKAINWYTNDDTVSFRCHSANEFSWSCGQTTMWFNYRTYSTQISTFYFGNGTNGGLGTIRAGAVYGAVWNDYAEYREGTTTEPGRVVATTQFSNKVSPTTQRLQPAAHVISDTAGYATGESDTAKTPLGVAGRVLVYPYRNINEYKVGDVLCAAPGGTADIMTRDEIMMYPDRIIGIVDEIPTYECWHQTLSCAKDEDKNKNGSTIAHVKVKGRIWMYIK